MNRVGEREGYLPWGLDLGSQEGMKLLGVFRGVCTLQEASRRGHKGDEPCKGRRRTVPGASLLWLCPASNAKTLIALKKKNQISGSERLLW